jgi:hypothetical protein
VTKLEILFLSTKNPYYLFTFVAKSFPLNLDENYQPDTGRNH